LDTQNTVTTFAHDQNSKIVYALDASNRAESDILKAIQSLLRTERISYLIGTKHHVSINYLDDNSCYYAQINYDGQNWEFIIRDGDADGEILHQTQNDFNKFTLDQLNCILSAIRRMFNAYRTPRKFKPFIISANDTPRQLIEA